jgi:hypothetical protein
MARKGNGKSLVNPPDQPFLVAVVISKRTEEKLLHACPNSLRRQYDPYILRITCRPAAKARALRQPTRYKLC